MLGKLNPFSHTSKDDVETSSTPAAADVKAEQGEKKGFVGNIKDKAVEKMLERQLKSLPAAQRDMMMRAIKSNPEFFETIAKKIKEEEKRNGGNQMAASMKVMREHQSELGKIMQEAQ